MNNIITKDEHLIRQADIIPRENQNIGITIIGAGAIGSHVALALVKSGFENVKVYDFDKVSIENMSCQGYRMGDIGNPKVNALREIVEMYTGVEIDIVNEKWSATPTENKIVISAVDSMEVRKDIFEGIIKTCFNTSFLIDPRMGAEVAALYCMNPHTESEHYARTLYSDADAVQERCTAKATNYTANMLSGLLVKAVKNIANKERYPRITQWNIANNSMDSWSKE